MKYLSVEQVILIHDRLIEDFGGLSGICSHSLLESALYRAEGGFGEEEFYKGVFEKAAVLFESLCKNHPFNDGNKRTAFVTAATFLEINGYETNFNQAEAETFVVQTAAGEVKFERIVAFFERNARKRY